MLRMKHSKAKGSQLAAFIYVTSGSSEGRAKKGWKSAATISIMADDLHQYSLAALFYSTSI